MAPKRATRSNIAPETTNTTSVTNAQLQAMINQGVTAALAVRDADKNTNVDDSHISGAGVRRTEQTARECTYTEFLKCQPLKFKGTEGVAGLSQWFEKMEYVFHISNCIVENQVKFATCTLLGNALTTKIKKLKVKLWDLKVKGTDVIGYNQHFQELALLCFRMFLEESDKIERYVSGLLDMIYGKNKRKQDNNQQQQPQNKRQNTSRAYAAETGQKPTFYECGAQGHFKRECPKLKNNNNRGNPAGNVNALAKVYAVGHAGTNPDSNVVIGTFLLNNRYASILFDTSADRSFMSTAFSSQIDITPTSLDHYYDIELADERIIRLNTILRGCTLNILNNPFNIDFMPVELGSFDAIIGMDWLVKYQAIIVCAEKIVRIPWGNETLIVHGDGSNRGNEAHMYIIS
ncbi:reverse transcriptase domain-containing protein, partial [Tanacetum coccineum]